MCWPHFDTCLSIQSIRLKNTQCVSRSVTNSKLMFTFLRFTPIVKLPNWFPTRLRFIHFEIFPNWNWPTVKNSHRWVDIIWYWFQFGENFMLGELQPHVNQRFSIKCRQNHPKKANIAKNRLKNTLKVGLCAVTAPHVMKNTCDNTLKSLPNEVLPALKSLPNEVLPPLGGLHNWVEFKMGRIQNG